MLWIKINKGCIKVAFFSSLLILCLFSCINDGDDGDVAMEVTSSLPELQLSFVIPNANVATRADDDYEDGSGYENQIDITDHDYRIYFFTYSDNDSYGGTLIAQFTPTRTTSSSSSNETLYTVTGVLPDALLDVSNFRAVVLANWGSYPEVEEGQTTIDDLTEDTEGTYSTFLAQDKFTLSANNLIPFYGVQEFTGVNIIEGGITELSDEVYLLRALAKVEIVLNDDDDDISFSEVTLHNYNSTGYSAPQGIYKAEDYHTGTWENDYVQSLHLFNNANDTQEKTTNFIKTKAREVDADGNVSQYETWELYIPEYDNTSADAQASYIEVKFNYQTENDEPYIIYFQDYNDDGTLDEEGATWDIYRNNLYRFNVSLGRYGLMVNVQDWENVFDNEWKFGEYSRLVYSDSDPNYFTDENGYIYASLVVEGNEDDEKNPTVYLQKVDDSAITASGYVSIPETVTYLGYTYTVVQIGSYCFEADTNVIFITIPKTITYIDTDAFHNDLSLKGFAIHCETPPECAYDAFDGDEIEYMILYVPTNSLEKYQTTSPWSSFGTIEGIDF